MFKDDQTPAFKLKGKILSPFLWFNNIMWICSLNNLKIYTNFTYIFKIYKCLHLQIKNINHKLKFDKFINYIVI